MTRLPELHMEDLEAVSLEETSKYFQRLASVGESYRDWETDRKSTRLNSSHSGESRMPSSA